MLATQEHQREALREKVKVLDSVSQGKKKKKSDTEMAKTYGKNTYSFVTL